MPRIKKNNSNSTPANKQKGKKVCSCCSQSKNLTDFYLNYSPMYSVDQRTPICKECCKTYALNEDGTVDNDKLNDLLRQIDRPLYYDLIVSAEMSVKKENSYISDEETKLHGYDILSKYFTLIAMRQDRAKSFSDSEKENFMHQNNNRSKEEVRQIQQNYPDNHFGKSNKNLKDDYELGDFKVTDDIKSLFGYGYTDIKYKKMFDKYEKLKYNYPLQTSLHQEALATYVRFKVQEEEATVLGRVDEAKKWYDAAQSAAEKGKLTPKQLSKEDLQSGVNSICELTKALEQAVDVVKILPQFKYRPNDAVDFTIMCYVNYERDLSGQTQVDYSDIYSFYDKKKAEYIEQNGDPFGIFTDDPTEKNRETVKTFIKLPGDYDELAGDDNDS